MGWIRHSPFVTYKCQIPNSTKILYLPVILQFQHSRSAGPVTARSTLKRYRSVQWMRSKQAGLPTALTSRPWPPSWRRSGAPIERSAAWECGEAFFQCVSQIRNCARNCKRIVSFHRATGPFGPGKAERGIDPRVRRPAWTVIHPACGARAWGGSFAAMTMRIC